MSQPQSYGTPLPYPPQPPPGYAQPMPDGRHVAPPPFQGPPPTKTGWWKRTWVVALAAGLVGIGLGAASAETDVTQSPEYESVAEDRDEAQAALDSAQDELADVQAELETIAGDLPDREAALEKLESEVADREKAVMSSEKAVAAEERAVARRERAVGIVERTIARNTISGDGLYEVGVDMRAGTYKANASSGCYYAVLGSSNTNNIKTNNLTDGPAIVTVAPGDFFETSRCGDWVLQR